jgi:UV DNA damage repair endonuclease
MHSFNNSVKRIGFACKWAEINKKGEIVSVKELNTGGTTLAWAGRQSKDVAEQKVIDIAKQNILNTHALIKKVAELPPELRMVRISSDMLDFYTVNTWQGFWQDRYMQDSLARWFAPLGETARKNDVRLSFHPGQFCCMASDNPDIVNNSIQEFEYHADMARWMGYGKQFQDLKINVHIAGRTGTEGMRRAYERLTPEARNCITIENEEISYGLSDCIELSDIIPIVLDIHHHWVKEGEYIQSNDIRVQRVIDSWRGIRPTCHYSVTREDVLVSHPVDILPNHDDLIASGKNKQKLRAHSNFYWNDSVNEWALTFRDSFDTMCESKAKNLASFKLYEKVKNF